MTDNIVLLRDILTERGQWHPRVDVKARTGGVIRVHMPKHARKGLVAVAMGILSGYPVLPIEIANRLGGS